MKKLYFFLLAICFIGTGCKKSNVKICDCGKVEINKTEYAAMCILPYEISINSENKLIMENHTKRFMSYGTPFSLEYFNENNWELIPLDDAVWETIELGLFAGETTERHTYLYSFVEKYNNGKKGKYRMIKSVSLHTEHLNNDDVISINLYAEFEIK